MTQETIDVLKKILDRIETQGAMFDLWLYHEECDHGQSLLIARIGQLEFTWQILIDMLPEEETAGLGCLDFNDLIKAKSYHNK
jgi:hypothetical protein